MKILTMWHGEYQGSDRDAWNLVLEKQNDLIAAGGFGGYSRGFESTHPILVVTLPEGITPEQFFPAIEFKVVKEKDGK